MNPLKNISEKENEALLKLPVYVSLLAVSDSKMNEAGKNQRSNFLI
jgi:hypothetical protein